jgi:hypothetical protein
MRFLLRGSILGIVIACTSPTSLPQPLDGVWNLQPAFASLAPRSMKLNQLGGAISGTGVATGVDRPIPIAISGSYNAVTPTSPPIVALSFRDPDNGGLIAQLDGSLQGTDRIEGSVIYNGIEFSQTDTVVYIKQ